MWRTAMAPTVEEQDGLIFAPGVAEQPRKKVSIMLRHWPEYNALYPYPGSPATRTRPAALEQGES